MNAAYDVMGSTEWFDVRKPSFLYKNPSMPLLNNLDTARGCASKMRK